VDVSERIVSDLARAILDGTPVDWRAVESTANETERPIFEQLRLLATLVDFHREQRATDEPAPRAKTWGHLRVLEPIGSGAFGQVYRAWDTRLDREVALKLLPTDSDAGDARASSIIEEGRLLARVRHPNIVTIYGAARIGDTMGLWMERIDGETVEQRLSRESPLKASDAIEIGIQICHAVSAVHNAGLLHRDIKAQNVMLARDGRAVLMDFGTGRELADASASVISLAGTPLYLAPELLRGGDATIQSDIYSLGVLLYRMVTGTYPVRACTLPDLRLAHARLERADDVELRPGMPRRLRRIIGRAIDPGPERRYESADALATALGTLAPHASVIPLRYAVAAAAVLVSIGLVLAEGPLRHYREPRSTLATLAQTSAVPRRSNGPAIAVLPLRNLSAEPGSEEFVDGFTEEIINSLAAREHLQVRSRASSFAFKNDRQDLREVARRLDVSLVLDGSVRRSENRFQIEARLVQAASGVTLWNDSFDTEIGDVFAVRDRITRSVIGRLGLEAGPTRRAYDVNSDAYGRYLTARALVSRRSVQSAQKAVEYFQQVIAIAPDFAPAYAGIADAYAYMSLPTYGGEPVNSAQALMRTNALKALQLDPDLAEAHAAMGVVYARDLDWASSERHFQQAIALNPSLSQVYTSYSFFALRPLRKFGESERLLKIALQSDPLSLDVWREMAELYFTVGRYDEAIDLLERVRAVDPQLPTADVVLARALACRGRVDEALALYDAFESQKPVGARTDPRLPGGVPHYQAYAYVKAGRRSDAERLAAENDRYPYRATIIYAALGDRDRAFEALERTAEREPQRVPLLLTWPEMAPLRDDPRFTVIRKRFGLP
jgi:serine/threonine protein kinase/tetratricopeptide (TPR) repeat protein